MSPAPPSAAARRRSRGGPLLLLLPLALLVLGLLHLWRREPLPAPAPPPGVSSPDETVSAWSGELLGAHGGWLVATLAPLHADPRRQAFEARSLARELGLEAGEPWRLSVRWESPRTSTDSTERPAGSRGDPGPAGGEGPGLATAAGIALGALAVEDGQGAALRSLEASQEIRGGQPVSPLRALVAPPQGALHVGEAADWILWGRAPRTGAHLVGLVPDGDELFQAATGYMGPFPLRATRVRRGDLGQPLARLERLPAGKRAPGEASDPGDEDARRDGR